VVDVQCTLLITENGIIGTLRLIASVEFSLCCRRIFGHVMHQLAPPASALAPARGTSSWLQHQLQLTPPASALAPAPARSA